MVSPVIKLAMTATFAFVGIGTVVYTGLLPDATPLDGQSSQDTVDSSISENDTESPGVERSGPPEGVSQNNVNQALVMKNHHNNLDSSDRVIGVEFNRSLGTIQARSIGEVRIDSDAGTKLVDLRSPAGSSPELSETIYIHNMTSYTRREISPFVGGEGDTQYSRRPLESTGDSTFPLPISLATYRTELRGNYTQYLGESSDGLYTLKSKAPVRATNGTIGSVLRWTSYVRLDGRGVIKSGNATFVQNSSVGENITSTLTYSTDDRAVEIEEPDWVSRHFNDSQVSTAGN